MSKIRFYTVKISNPASGDIVKSIKNAEQNIIISKVNWYEDELSEVGYTNYVFMLLGGDNVPWAHEGKGLIGFGKIIGIRDKGYDKASKKNFRIEVNMIFAMNRVITRRELVSYADAYDVGNGAGPTTKGIPNQVIYMIEENQAATLLRAMLDRQNELMGKISTLPEKLQEKIKGNVVRYISKNVAFGEKLEEIGSQESMDETKKGPRIDGATNRLFYGVPGCGKSYTVDKRIKDDGFQKDIRVVFHPDYTYYDFVGQIAPRVEVEGDSSKVRYVFTPGPFTQILKYAHDNPDHKCLLIIEELNRGNAPAIFGELFQLLDRSEEPENLGESKYGVTNYEIAEYVYGDREHEVKIPSNLSIYATMNTSDQNVFTLDTAFQRRWFMNHVPNKFVGKHAACIIAGTEISWGAFATVVNDRLHDELGSLCSSEDKSLGAYFATDSDLESRDRFSEKVLKYLWDDAFKMSRESIFDIECKSLGDVIEWFQESEEGLKKVLQKEVYQSMAQANAKFLEAGVEEDTENSIGE